MRFRKWIKLKNRKKRHKRLRNKVCGTLDVPRVSVFRSLKNLYIQLIDDANGKTLYALSTRDPECRDKMRHGGGIEAASLLGEFVAKGAKEKGIEKVVFDRSGYQYHGRIKAFAESARKHGLKF